ncbi:hypothetical protein ACFYNY_20565 [Streptomyces sp. NPDC006530]|uniref:hypothetical protein n=1 Tax=Streptomyces sp. NPDC006530 TaxID=3364750 RepID=UPI00369ECD0B
MAPLTNNTLAKWATGISDTVALGLISKGIGLGLPIIALPHFNNAQAAHPAVAGHIAFLRDAGVTVPLGKAVSFPASPSMATLTPAHGRSLSMHSPPAARSPRCRSGRRRGGRGAHRLRHLLGSR